MAAFGAAIASGAGNAIGGSLAGNLLEQFNYQTGKWTGYNDEIARNQVNQQRELGLVNYQYQSMLNNQALENSKNLFQYQADYNNYLNNVKRMKEAGLSIGLMYSGGAATQAGGASMPGGTAGGANASNETERRMSNQRNMEIGLSLASLKSQIDLNESQADKNSAEAENLRGIDRNKANTEIEVMKNEMNKIIAEISNKRAQTRLIELQSDFQDIQNIIGNATINTQIDIIHNNLEERKQTVDQLIRENWIRESAKKQIVDHYWNENKLILQQIIESKNRGVMMKSEIKMNIAKQQDMVNQITLKLKEFDMKMAISKMEDNFKWEEMRTHANEVLAQCAAMLEAAGIAADPKIMENLESMLMGKSPAKPIKGFK